MKAGTPSQSSRHGTQLSAAIAEGNYTSLNHDDVFKHGVVGRRLSTIESPHGGVSSCSTPHGALGDGAVHGIDQAGDSKTSTGTANGPHTPPKGSSFVGVDVGESGGTELHAGASASQRFLDRGKRNWAKLTKFARGFAHLRMGADRTEHNKVCDGHFQQPHLRPAFVLSSSVPLTFCAQIFGQTMTELQLDNVRLATPWMVHPDKPWRRWWGLIMVGAAHDEALVLSFRVAHALCSCAVEHLQTFTLIASVFATPFELAFSFTATFSGDTSEIIWATVDLLMVCYVSIGLGSAVCCQSAGVTTTLWNAAHQTVCFALDIIVTFRTAVLVDDDVIQDGWVCCLCGFHASFALAWLLRRGAHPAPHWPDGGDKVHERLVHC